LVDERLRWLLDREQNVPAPLLDAMRYSLLAPGKRLRPCLVFMAAEAAGGAVDQAWPAACAVEMIHAYSLIHDDLPAMDDDDLRRGRPTCHRQFGEALAILAGDALLTMAFQAVTEHLPAKTAAKCTLELARATGAAGMVGGQAEDLAWERLSAQEVDPRKTFPRTEQPHTLAALEHIHRLKTGALFQVCLRLGVLSVLGEKADKASESLLQALDAYGQRFGLVFQITDDLLDVEGTVAATGKQVNKDSARGKLTYPSFLGVAASRARAVSLRQEAIAASADLGSRAEPLAALMNYVVERKR
jgi:geranylgeranyl diphosphate synthase type II